jgi:hypothetical protein
MDFIKYTINNIVWVKHDDYLEYAQRILKALVEKNYPDIPLNIGTDLVTVLMQIDNLTTSLVRAKGTTNDNL